MKPEFLAAAQRHNRLSLLVICVMIFGMELFNMARVLFWSASGLGTLNNRIYFAFYSSLFLAAALYLLLAWLLRRRAPGVKLALQYACAAFCLVWHVCMNAYDILAGHSLETGIYLTAVLGMGVFILMPAWLSLPCTGGLPALMALAAPSLDSGQLINLSLRPSWPWPPPSPTAATTLWSSPSGRRYAASTNGCRSSCSATP